MAQVIGVVLLLLVMLALVVVMEKVEKKGMKDFLEYRNRLLEVVEEIAKNTKELKPPD